MRLLHYLAILIAAMCLSPTMAPTLAHAQDDSDSATLTPHVLAPNLVVISGAGGNSTLLWGPDGSLVIDTVRAARAEGKTLEQIQALNIARLYAVRESFLPPKQFLTSVYNSPAARTD